jgi:hypothetical protein
MMRYELKAFSILGKCLKEIFCRVVGQAMHLGLALMGLERTRTFKK